MEPYGRGNICKMFLIIVSVIFAVLGLTSMGLGLWLRFSCTTRGIFQVDAHELTPFTTGVTVLVVQGSAMLVMAIFGSYGARSDQTYALFMFFFLCLLFMGEFIFGLLLVCLHDTANKFGLYMANIYSSTYRVYSIKRDPVIGVTLKFIQEYFHCCGVTGVPLVEIAKETCPRPDDTCQDAIVPSMKNCPEIIWKYFASKEPLLLGVLIGIGTLMIIALICSSVQVVLVCGDNTVNPPPPKQPTTKPNKHPVVVTVVTADQPPAAQM